MTSPVLALTEDDYGYPDIETKAADAHAVRLLYCPTPISAPLPAEALAADGLLCRYRRIEDRDLHNARWRVVGRYGVGVDNVDVTAADRRGIAIVNMPDYCAQEVAAHAMMLLLAALRQLPAASACVSGARWNDASRLRGLRVPQDLTLGIIGLGRVGKEVARCAQSLFGRVLACDLLPGAEAYGCQSATLEDLLAQSDAVTLHVPLTPSTMNLLDASALDRMPRGAVVVNVSRGALLDEAALLTRLDDGRLGAAGLDVTDPEPPALESPLLRHSRVLVTPHVAWLSDASVPRLRHVLADRCARYLSSGPTADIFVAGRAGRT